MNRSHLWCVGGRQAVSWIYVLWGFRRKVALWWQVIFFWWGCVSVYQKVQGQCYHFHDDLWWTENLSGRHMGRLPTAPNQKRSLALSDLKRAVEILNYFACLTWGPAFAVCSGFIFFTVWNQFFIIVSLWRVQCCRLFVEKNTSCELQSAASRKPWKRLFQPRWACK